MAGCYLKQEQEQLKSRITESPEKLTNCRERMKQAQQKIKKDKVNLNIKDIFVFFYNLS